MGCTMNLLAVSQLILLKAPYCLSAGGNAIYLDRTSRMLIDQPTTTNIDLTALSGTLGKVAFSSFGANTYFYILNGVVNVNTGGTTTTVLNDVGGTIVDIATCCGRLLAVIDYGGDNYYVAVYYMEYTKLLFPLAGRMCIPRISVDCTNRILYFTTDRGINQWDFTDINMNPVQAFSTELNAAFPDHADFGSCPLDLLYVDNAGAQLYFTLMNSARLFGATSGQAPALVQDYSADHAAVTYLAADTTCLYYGSVSAGGAHELFFRSRATLGNAATSVATATEVSGITVCEGGCAETCPAACTTCALCGLCLPAAAGTTNAGTCVCTYFPQDRCVFSGETIPAGCANGPAQPDLMCAIINPVVGRRPPSRNIEVHAIFDTAPTAEFAGATYTTEEVRRVKTGRWTGLPDNLLERQYNNANRKALVFKAQPKSRGQRFGVFAAQMVQSNGRDQGYVFSEALCIAQENSKLFSPCYTMISSVGQPDIVLRAYVPPDRLRRIRWSRTDINTGERTEMAIRDSRSITIPSVVENNGIYEAYVDSRYLRTWHAMYYVIVRRCNPIAHGATCESICSDCTANRGVCDETSGACKCFAGFQHSADPGEDCGEPCPAGMVGQTCNINCEEEFNQPGCRNILFCSPYPVGCHCYQESIAPGFQPPYCACPTGMYGPNCENTCACQANQICDAIEGCITDYMNI